jgi:hypothetical protein
MKLSKNLKIFALVTRIHDEIEIVNANISLSQLIDQIVSISNNEIDLHILFSINFKFIETELMFKGEKIVAKVYFDNFQFFNLIEIVDPLTNMTLKNAHEIKDEIINQIREITYENLLERAKLKWKLNSLNKKELSQFYNDLD